MTEKSLRDSVVHDLVVLLRFEVVARFVGGSLVRLEVNSSRFTSRRTTARSQPDPRCSHDLRDWTRQMASSC